MFGCRQGRLDSLVIRLHSICRDCSPLLNRYGKSDLVFCRLSDQVHPLVIIHGRSSMIPHTVVFKLVHEPGSNKERIFLNKARSLGKLSMVVDLKVLRQVGKKNQYTFGLSMYFQSEVDEFLEIDYVEIQH